MEYIFFYRQSRCHANDTAIVNAAFRVHLDRKENGYSVADSMLVYGGVGSTTVIARKTMEAIKGRWAKAMKNSTIFIRESAYCINGVRNDMKNGGLARLDAHVSCNLEFNANARYVDFIAAANVVRHVLYRKQYNNRSLSAKSDEFKQSKIRNPLQRNDLRNDLQTNFLCLYW